MWRRRIVVSPWLEGVICSFPRIVQGGIRTVVKGPTSWMRLLLIMTCGFGVSLLLTIFYKEIISPDEIKRHWILRLIDNLLGYQVFLFPGFLVLSHLRSSGYLLELGESLAIETLADRVIKLLYIGQKEINLPSTETNPSPSTKSDTRTQIFKLLFCVCGLQGSFLMWGYLQERVMTKDYIDSAGNSKRFTDSQFLIFANRMLGLSVALLYIMVQPQKRTSFPPVYKYSYCSFSNIMSSWCQYEALKFVSFPTQVLSKASKIIPVMIMGTIVSGKKYEFYEYLVALLISFGMALFFFGSSSGADNSSHVTTITGGVLLLSYMAFDAFTSNWQGELFSSYKVSSVEMMAGVNFFSCLLTSTSLLGQGAFYESLVFMSQFPQFTFDCIVFSVCSATGQLFIYYTISQFGPLVFVIIMTLRQAMAIFISCLIFSHPLDSIGIIGIFIVFASIFLKIYYSYRLKQLKKSVVTPSK